MGIPSQAEYERREHALFHQQLKNVEKAPLSERKENAEEFADALKHRPRTVVERIGWLLNGSYGVGSYEAANKIAKNTRMNAGAWLTTTIAAIEWGTPQRMAIAAWKKLTPVEQNHLRRMIEDAVHNHFEE
jgi:hypothetical protein